MARAAALPFKQFQSMYVDKARHNALGAVMRWCDTFGSLYAESMNIDDDKTHEIRKLQTFQYVNRITHVQILVGGQSWEDALVQSSGVSLSQCLSKVGRTSCATFSSGSTSAGTELFRFNTVYVNVDAEDSAKTIPIVYPEEHKAAVHAVPDIQVPPVCPRPADAFIWHTTVRHTDCDLIGHMNNAVYGDLMEDCRRQAAAMGVFKGVEAAMGDVHMVSVEYMGQPKAGQDLDIAVWWDQGSRLLGFEFLLEGKEVVTKCVMVPWRDQDHGNSKL